MKLKKLTVKSSLNILKKGSSKDFWLLIFSENFCKKTWESDNAKKIDGIAKTVWVKSNWAVFSNPKSLLINKTGNNVAIVFNKLGIKEYNGYSLYSCITVKTLSLVISLVLTLVFFKCKKPIKILNDFPDRLPKN